MQDQIMKELSKRLTAGGQGNCPLDDSCRFGFGVQECAAGVAAIKNEFKQLREESTAMLFVDGDPSAKPWPCLTCLKVDFVEPENPES